MSWSETQRAAAERLDAEVSSLLAQFAGERWGAGRGRDWQVVASLDQASWRLYHLLETAADGEQLFEMLGVRATVAPDGRVVAYQVDDGEQFLALAEVSPASLLRGLGHLADQGLPPQRSADAPFRRPERSPSFLRRLFSSRR